MSATRNQIDEFCARLSDEEFAECVRAALEMNRYVKESGRRVFMKLKNPRASQFLTEIVYDTFAMKAQRVVEPLPSLDDLM